MTWTQISSTGFSFESPIGNPSMQTSLWDVEQNIAVIFSSCNFFSVVSFFAFLSQKRFCLSFSKCYFLFLKPFFDLLLPPAACWCFQFICFTRILLAIINNNYIFCWKNCFLHEFSKSAQCISFW